MGYLWDMYGTCMGYLSGMFCKKNVHTAKFFLAGSMSAPAKKKTVTSLFIPIKGSKIGIIGFPMIKNWIPIVCHHSKIGIPYDPRTTRI